ncbi:rod shape-determining protein MreC [Jatrophihabitans sp.]|uniref:rod shape-determining protein MreC n=1 Tax=Jatrophihabitans sp. TaxID=1932789 RepID=UPI002CC20B34|nr:rod shape-determining protein MreC [Jatrophihabitans sp.]
MRRLTRRQQLAAAVLAVLALLFLSLDFAGGSLAGARGGTTGALGSLYRGTDAVLGPVRRFVQGVPDVAGNRREIAQLTQRNADLQRQLAAAAADAATARQLRALQLQADTADWRLMPARVIATGPGAGFQWSVTLDVGSREHVQVGQTVTDGLGLVGRVVAVHATTSVVLLAADPTSGVGVRDVRSGALLLAEGAGSGPLTASALEDGVDVRVGDRLVTGPAGKTTYAAGVAVGVVTSVHDSADGTVSVRLRPVSRQAGLDLVGIILSEPRGTARPALEPASGSDR